MCKLARQLVTLLLLSSSLCAIEKTREEMLKEESNAILERCQKIAAAFYCLEDNEDIKEITADILDSEETKESIKQIIISSGRRFLLFKYPSDGFQVKGCISFVPNPSGNPLLIFLRGGNRMFGLPHPATDVTCMRNYTVITTTYRGGVSEGTDEYGGCEVNDIDNLMQYFPALQQKIGVFFNPKQRYMLGYSRGAMEMFLALSRTPQLQYQIEKAASLTGLLDMYECLRYREDMKQMFIKDFGLIPLENEESWIKQRNPLDIVQHIRNDLPILIIQGTHDIRVSLEEGYRMVGRLEEQGNPVTYLEVPDGEHGLTNQTHRMDLIADWFELEF